MNSRNGSVMSATSLIKSNTINAGDVGLLNSLMKSYNKNVKNDLQSIINSELLLHIIIWEWGVKIKNGQGGGRTLDRCVISTTL